MYGQVWSTVLGLGLLLPAEQIAQHLRTELRRNDGPYGLTIITHNDTSQPQLAENSDSHYPETQTHTRAETQRKKAEAADLDCAVTSSKAHQNTVWMGAPSDWAAAAIALGGGVDMSICRTQRVSCPALVTVYIYTVHDLYR